MMVASGAPWGQLGHYQNVPQIRRDVEALLSQTTSLRAHVGEFVLQGRPTRLLYLYGTIAIYYKAQQYNIPVTIYIDPPYPKTGPRCFVSPTQGMAIKQRHRHCDKKGMIYLPYLANWNPTTCSLPELVTVISSTFSADPPVYAIPAGSVEPPPQSPSPPFHSGSQHPPPHAPSPSTSSSGQPPRISSSSNTIQSTIHNHLGDGPAKVVGGIGNFFSRVVLGNSPPAGAAPNRPWAADGGTSVSPSPSGKAAVKDRKTLLIEEIEGGVKKDWNATVAPIISRLEALLDMQDDRDAFAQRLADYKERIKTEEENIDSDMRTVALAKQSAVVALSSEKQKKIVADLLVTPSDDVSAQLLQLSAELAAHDDQLEQMDLALAAKAIPLSQFLEEVREASKARFMVKIKRNKLIRQIRLQQLNMTS